MSGNMEHLSDGARLPEFSILSGEGVLIWMEGIGLNSGEPRKPVCRGRGSRSHRRYRHADNLPKLALTKRNPPGPSRFRLHVFRGIAQNGTETVYIGLGLREG